MAVLWQLLFLTIGTAADFNPMELYLNSKEGVSFAFIVDGVKQYSYFWWISGGVLPGEPGGMSVSIGADYKNLGNDTYTRMLVTERLNADSDEFMIQFNYYNVFWHTLLEGVPIQMSVVQNSDSTVALRCHYSGLYVTWSNDIGNGNGMNDGDGLNDEAVILHNKPPICTEPDICPTCRFSLETGSVTDISIRLVDLTWGDPEEAIPSSPSQVMEDNMNNYSDTETQTTLKVAYTQTTSDTTIWEHAWGFELSVSAEVEANIPFFGGGSVTTRATASYNGKYGTENTVQDSSTVEDSKTVTCPPKTRCTLKLVASKLDDYNIPFTALVERTQDVGPPLQWQESGVWRGVQAFNFETIYCTTDLASGATNCPQFELM